MKEKAVVDRIVDDRQAVLLVGEAELERIVLLAQLPAQAAEGVWLQVVFEGEQLVEAAVDLAETERMRNGCGSGLTRRWHSCGSGRAIFSRLQTRRKRRPQRPRRAGRPLTII
jgi:hypothetical protein